jgi:pimeloyl-ACP methyl ester carboxylesterase
LLELLFPPSVHRTKEQRTFIVDNAFMAGCPSQDALPASSSTTGNPTPRSTAVPYEQIRVPTLIFQASDDARELAGGQQIARRIPDSRLVTMTGGHVLIGHDQQIRDEIDRFVAQAGSAHRR